METNPQMNVPAPGMSTPDANPMVTAVPLGAKIIAVLYYLVSIVLIFGGIMAAVISSLSISFLGIFGVRAGLIPGILSVAQGILFFLAGRGLWSGKKWGRILAITFSLLQIIFGIIILTMFSGANYILIPLVVNLVIVLYLFFSKSVSTTFQSAEPMMVAVVLAILAVVVYGATEYPNLTPQQTALNQANQLAGQIVNQLRQNQALYQQSNKQNTGTPQNTYTPDPLYGPVVQTLTPAGTYSNTIDGFQMNIPFSYSVQEKQSPSGNGILISSTQTAMILIANGPTTLSLRDAINKYRGDLVTNDTFINTTIAGETAMQDTGNPAVKNPLPNSTVNIYFLIHNGIYYMFQKTGSFKIGQVITDDQFNSAIRSLSFTK